MRFGLVYKGVTNFQIENNSVSSFSPSSFFVIEENLKGQQSWKKGQHFHGTEITIHEKYFKEIIYPHFSKIDIFDSIIKNHTYTYLPLEIVGIIHQLQSLSHNNFLNNIYLESKVLECIAILINELTQSPKNTFTNQIDYGNIKIGNNYSSNFSKMFKKTYGKTPLKFRKTK